MMLPDQTPPSEQCRACGTVVATVTLPHDDQLTWYGLPSGYPWITPPGKMDGHTGMASCDMHGDAAAVPGAAGLLDQASTRMSGTPRYDLLVATAVRGRGL